MIVERCCLVFLNCWLSFFLPLFKHSAFPKLVNSLKSASAIFWPPCSVVFEPGLRVKLILKRVWPVDVVVLAAVNVVVEQFDAEDDDDDEWQHSFGFVDVMEPNVPAVNETDWIFAERSAIECGRFKSAAMDFLGIWDVVVVEWVDDEGSLRRWDDLLDLDFVEEDFLDEDSEDVETKIILCLISQWDFVIKTNE